MTSKETKVQTVWITYEGHSGSEWKRQGGNQGWRPPPLSCISRRSHCIRGLQLVSADGMRSPPWKIRTGSPPFGASQMVQTQWPKSLSNWRGGGRWGETQDSGNRHTFQSRLDFSRFLNGSIYKCPQCPGQCGYQGRRLRLVLEVGGGGFCPILSKLLTGP